MTNEQPRMKDFISKLEKEPRHTQRPGDSLTASDLLIALCVIIAIAFAVTAT